MPDWFVDRSRYMQGFECPMSRYWKYHHLGRGIVPAVESPETKMGHLIHSNVELGYLWARDSGGPPSKQVAIDKIVKDIYGDRTEEDAAWFRGESVIGLSHAYLRAVLPWIVERYEVVSVEQEYTLDLGFMGSQYTLKWMARPDVTLRSKTTGNMAIAEFKTTRSKPETVAAIHTTSLQSIMNAHAVAEHHQTPCEAVQIHLLALGTDAYPTTITHAHYRPGQPPFVSEDWKPLRRGSYPGKLYKKVNVSDYRPLVDWIWSMPMQDLQELVPIHLNPIDPTLQGVKVVQAIASIRRNEQWWMETLARLKGTDARYEATKLIPRTFNCIQYQRNCDYMDACFDLLNDFHLTYAYRTPHHTQEIIDMANKKGHELGD